MAFPEPAAKLAVTTKPWVDTWLYLSDPKAGVVAISAVRVKAVHPMPFHPRALVWKAVFGRWYLVTLKPLKDRALVLVANHVDSELDLVWTSKLTTEGAALSHFTSTRVGAA